MQASEMAIQLYTPDVSTPKIRLWFLFGFLHLSLQYGQIGHDFGRWEMANSPVMKLSNAQSEDG